MGLVNRLIYDITSSPFKLLDEHLFQRLVTVQVDATVLILKVANPNACYKAKKVRRDVENEGLSKPSHRKIRPIQSNQKQVGTKL